MKNFDMVGSPVNWNTLLPWMAAKWKSKKPKDTIPRMCLGIVVYAIWTERNARIFNHKEKTQEMVLQTIILLLQNQILSRWRSDPHRQQYLVKWAKWP